MDWLIRREAEDVPVEEKQTQVTGSKRKRNGDVKPNSKSFDWADISLSHTTRLHLKIHGQPLYPGGAAFVTAQTALLELRCVHTADLRRCAHYCLRGPSRTATPHSLQPVRSYVGTRGSTPQRHCHGCSPRYNSGISE